MADLAEGDEDKDGKNEGRAEAEVLAPPPRRAENGATRGNGCISLMLDGSLRGIHRHELPVL